MKQGREKPAKLRDDGPAKAQGGGDVKTSMDDQMEHVQGAAIPSFCRNNTAEAASLCLLSEPFPKRMWRVCRTVAATPTPQPCQRTGMT